MKCICVALILLTSTFLDAQKCRYEKNEVDDFTGDKVVITKYDRIKSSAMETVSIKAKSIAGVNYLWFQIQHGWEMSVKEGAEFLLKRKDGELIKLNVLKDASSKFDNRGRFWYINIEVKIPDRRLFLPSEIEKMRISYSDKEYDYDFPKKNGGKFLQAIGCLAKAGAD